MTTSAAYEERRLRLLARLAVGTRVLDLGYARQPNPYLEGFHRVGVDLERPADHGVRYEEEILGDVMTIGQLLEGRVFDTIVCGELIEHLENPYALLRALRPLLSDDGRLLVSTPNPLSIPVFVAEVMRSRRFFFTRDHLYYFLPRWVERLLEKTGYVVERLQPVGLWTPWRALPVVPVAMSYQVIYVGRKRSA